MKNTESSTSTPMPTPNTTNKFDLNNLKSARPQKSMVRIKSLKPTRSNQFRSRKVSIKTSK
jgi:hypothetical protein